MSDRREQAIATLELARESLLHVPDSVRRPLIARE
jgi:hypothetical protein